MPRGSNSQTISIRTTYDGRGSREAQASIKSLDRASGDLAKNSAKHSAIAETAVQGYSDRAKASQEAMAKLREEIAALSAEAEKMASKESDPRAVKKYQAEIARTRAEVKALEKDIDKAVQKPRKSKGLNLSFKNVFNAGINAFGAVTAGVALANAFSAMKKPTNAIAKGKGGAMPFLGLGKNVGEAIKESGVLVDSLGGVAMAIGKIARSGAALGPMANAMREAGGHGTALGFVISATAKAARFGIKGYQELRSEIKQFAGEEGKLSDAMKNGMKWWHLALFPVRAFGKAIQSTGTAVNQFGRLRKIESLKPIGLGIGAAGKALYDLGRVGMERKRMVSQTVQDGRRVQGAGQSMAKSMRYFGVAFGKVPQDAAKAFTRVTNLTWRMVDQVSKATRTFKLKDHPLSQGFESVAKEAAKGAQSVWSKVKAAASQGQGKGRSPGDIHLQWFAESQKSIFDIMIENFKRLRATAGTVIANLASQFVHFGASIKNSFTGGLSGIQGFLGKLGGAATKTYDDIVKTAKRTMKTLRSDDLVNSAAKAMFAGGAAGLRGIGRIAATGSPFQGQGKNPLRTNDMANATIILKSMSVANRNLAEGFIKGMMRVRIAAEAAEVYKKAWIGITRATAAAGHAIFGTSRRASNAFGSVGKAAVKMKNNLVAAFRVVNFGGALLGFIGKLNNGFRESLGLGPKVKKSLVEQARGYLQLYSYAVYAFQSIKRWGQSLVAKNLEVASSLEEASSKFGFSFGSGAEKNMAWVDKFTKDVRRSRVDVITWMADFQNVITALGMGDDEAAKMSQGLTQLTVDLASFSNMKESDVAQSLLGGITGETENLKKFGVVIREADLEAAAFRMGIEKVGETFDGAQKSQIIYNLLMERTKKAQGDAVRTAGSFANKMRSFGATVTSMRAAIGDAMKPAATKIVSYFEGVGQRILAAFTRDKEKWVAVFDNFANHLITAFSMIEERLSQIDPSTIQAILDWIGDTFKKIVDILLGMAKMAIMLKLIVDFFGIMVAVIRAIPAELVKVIAQFIMLISFAVKVYNFQQAIIGVVAVVSKWVIVQKALNAVQAIFNILAAANPYVLLAAGVLSLIAVLGGQLIMNKLFIKDMKDMKKEAASVGISRGNGWEKEEEEIKALTEKYRELGLAKLQADINAAYNAKTSGGILLKDEITAVDNYVASGAKGPMQVSDEYKAFQKLVALRDAMAASQAKQAAGLQKELDLYKKSLWFVDALNSAYSVSENLLYSGLAYQEYAKEAAGARKDALLGIIATLGKERDLDADKKSLEENILALQQKRATLVEASKGLSEDAAKDMREQITEIDKQLVGLDATKANWTQIVALIPAAAEKLKTLAEAQKELAKSTKTGVNDRLVEAVASMEQLSSTGVLEAAKGIGNLEDRLSALQSIYDTISVSALDFVQAQKLGITIAGQDKLPELAGQIKALIDDLEKKIEDAKSYKSPEEISAEYRKETEKGVAEEMALEVNRARFLADLQAEALTATGERAALVARIVKQLREESGEIEKQERLQELIKASREASYELKGGEVKRLKDEIAELEKQSKEGAIAGMTADQLEGFQGKIADLKRQIVLLENPTAKWVESLKEGVKALAEQIPYYEQIKTILQGLKGFGSVLISGAKAGIGAVSGPLSRGAGALGNVASKGVDAFLATKVGGVVSLIGEKLGGAIQSLMPAVSRFGEVMVGAAQSAVGFGSILASAGMALLEMAMNTDYFRGIMEVVNSFMEQVVLPIASALAVAIQPLVVWVIQMAQILGVFLVPIIQVVGLVLQALQPLFVAMAVVVVELLKALMPLLPVALQLVTIVGQFLAPIFVSLGAVLRPVGMLLDALQPVLTVVGVAFDAIGRVVSTVALVFGFLLSNLIAFGAIVGYIVTFQWGKIGGVKGQTAEELGAALKDVWTAKWAGVGEQDFNVTIDETKLAAILDGIKDPMKLDSTTSNLLSSYIAASTTSPASAQATSSNLSVAKQPDRYYIVQIDGSTVVAGLDTMRIVTLQDIVDALRGLDTYQEGLSG